MRYKDPSCEYMLIAIFCFIVGCVILGTFVLFHEALKV